VNGIIEKRVSSGTKYKPDYEIVNKNKRVQGEKAEVYVLKSEKEYLISVNRRDLESKVSQLSLTDDSLGYDIISFDKFGKATICII
jgi:hypothetical protein